MRAKEKKRTKIRKSAVGILFMLVCVFTFSCVINADDYLIIDYEREGEHSNEETAYVTHADVIIGSIDQYNNPDCYRYSGFGYDYGYYTFTFKTLSDIDVNEKMRVIIFMRDEYGRYPLWEYNGKMTQSLKANIGTRKCSDFYIDISGPANMKYKCALKFHESQNWEEELNKVYYNGSLIDFNKKYHGSTCYSDAFSAYDYDYYELDVPSTGIMTFEMDRTPKNNHTIMVYDEKPSLLWQTKVTSGSHVSKNIKVKTGTVYIKIYGTNNEKYDFVLTHKQTTNTPGKTHITRLWGINKGMKIAWKKAIGTFNGYQIQYSKDEKFKNGVSSKYVSGKNTTKTVINGLEKNTDYYFRVRTYNKVNNKMYYSPWSEARNNSTL